MFLSLAPRPERKETELAMVVATPSQTSWPQSSPLSAPEAISETFGFERWSVRATVVVRKSRERLCFLHEVSAHRAAICRHPLSKTTCSGRDLGRHRGHIRYRCSVPSSTSRPLPECSGYWVLWGRGMFSSQEGGTHTVVIGVVFPPPTAVHLRGVMGHDSTFPDHYITSASLDK